MSPTLSVLELIPLGQGSSSRTAVRNSLELARLVDRLGYARLWYAEHHNLPTVLSTSPAVMIGLAAEATTRIRVGSGGVMLPNHAPLQVAETFKLLEALHPGRIDLGLGRAPGTDPKAALALRGSREALGADDFPEQLAELLAFGGPGLPAGHPLQGVRALPLDVGLPPIWMLGSSDYGAQLAAQLGMGFAFAAHFSDYPADEVLLDYRTRFRPGALERPHAILTLSVVCAETDAEAERLAESQRVSFARLRTGQEAVLLSPEEAAAYRYTPLERAVADAARARAVVGSPETVQRRILALAERTRADEVMVTTIVHGHAERLRSFELLAKALGL